VLDGTSQLVEHSLEVQVLEREREREKENGIENEKCRAF
jgi:hypothetical protein